MPVLKKFIFVCTYVGGQKKEFEWEAGNRYDAWQDFTYSFHKTINLYDVVGFDLLEVPSAESKSVER